MEALETSFERPKEDQTANDVAPPAPRTQEEDYIMRMGDSGPYPNPDEWN